jgi:hypothetical protein
LTRPLDRILLHQDGDFIEWSLCIGGKHITNHDIRHFARMRFDVFGGERLIGYARYKSQSAGCPSFRPCFRAMQQVALAHDPD